MMASLSSGISLIFITHFLDQVYEVCDRITVLRNGELVGTRDTSELPRIELVKMMLGRELDDNALRRAGKTHHGNAACAGRGCNGRDR